MIGYGMFIVLVLVMKLTPHSSLGRWLNAALVERPLERLTKMDRRHLIFLLLVIGVALFASEAIMAMGSFDLFTAFAWDLSVYLDVMVFTYALATIARGRQAARWLALRGALLLRRRPRSRARRSSAVRKPAERSDNDDDPAPAWRIAA